MSLRRHFSLVDLGAVVIMVVMGLMTGYTVQADLVSAGPTPTFQPGSGLTAVVESGASLSSSTMKLSFLEIGSQSSHTNTDQTQSRTTTESATQLPPGFHQWNGQVHIVKERVSPLLSLPLSFSPFFVSLTLHYFSFIISHNLVQLSTLSHSYFIFPYYLTTLYPLSLASSSWFVPGPIYCRRRLFNLSELDSSSRCMATP